MSDMVNKLAFRFYRQAAAGKSRNFVFSPYCLMTAFALAREGAAGKTAEEMDKVFSFSAGPEKRKDAAAKIAKALEISSDGTDFADASSLWLQKGTYILPEYEKRVKKFCGAKTHTADFLTNSEKSRGKINSWTEKNTRGLIKNLLPQNSINKFTKMILVSAVYFYGEWQDKFIKFCTKAELFYPHFSKKKSVKMMRKTEFFPYCQKNGVQYLSLPYIYDGDEEDSGMEMLIVLPKDKGTFIQTEKHLSPQDIANIRKEMKTEYVSVSIPKFKIRYSAELKEYMYKLGMKTPFSYKADFSGITDAYKLKIDSALHKAYISVTEDGTEASAATAIFGGYYGCPPKPKHIFRANKPFIFFIREKKTGLILFMGKLENP